MDKTSRCSFRIFGESDNEQEVNALLRLEASRWKDKESKVARANERNTGELRSVWIWDAPENSSLLPHEAVAEVVAMLESRRDAVATVVERAWRADILLDYGSYTEQGGMTFAADLLIRVAELKVGLAVNVWFWGTDRE